MEAESTSPPTEKGETFQSFVKFLQDPDLPATAISPKRFSEAIHTDLQTLANQAHVHRNTITRAPASLGVQQFLREAVRVIKAATDLHGDLNKALFWYRNEPLATFDYKTAETLVADGRADDVIRYLTSLGAGFSG
jgi:hypothetical protein